MSADSLQANRGHENVSIFRFQVESKPLKATYKPNFSNYMSADRLQANRRHKNVSIFRFQLESNLLKATYHLIFGNFNCPPIHAKKTADMKMFQFFTFNLNQTF